ncbi:MAG: hypothetical protein Harvfovirus33_5 [Harvfovirus sp.]|uniref:Glycosyl transferase family 25 domain-containing protein n=1 Tax=Harvfovirus sp. TaxID=2487768 RepID=A0A3G5A2G7_9VIRU|nr:MAG: hypothetical protein Harvfovirus33_5 [Harvfovirus sp.]
MHITRSTPVYYINLDNSKERRKNIIMSLRRLGFENITRIPAIDTRTDQKVRKYSKMIDPSHYEILKHDNKVGHRQFFGAITNGSIGCYLSHLNAYRKILENMDDSALIFEDDIIIDLPKNIFWDRVNQLHIPETTDIYLLDGTYYDSVRRIKEGSTTLKIERFTGLYSYFLTNAAAKILVKYLPVRQAIKYQIDFEISILMKANLLKVYGYRGDTITRHDYAVFKSTMQNLDCTHCYMKDLNLEARNVVREGFSEGDQGNYDIILIIVIICFLLYKMV